MVIELKRIQILLFKTGSCGSCMVVEEIVDNLVCNINNYYGAKAVDLEKYDLEDPEGYSTACQMNVASTPTLVIQGKKYMGKATNDELLQAIAMELGMAEKD